MQNLLLGKLTPGDQTQRAYQSPSLEDLKRKEKKKKRLNLRVLLY